jgi:hypothetical protein
MPFVFYSSLKPGAKKAINRGEGIYKKYCVSKEGTDFYIASVENGRPGIWHKVLFIKTKFIKAVEN